MNNARSMQMSRGLVVIADDDAEVRDLLADRFAAAGYEVVTASHGAEMIELLETVHEPSAIFVDLLMPGVVGHSVVDFIQSEQRLASVPMAVLTGSPELAPAGVKVFTKPARFDVLLAFVNGHGDHRVVNRGPSTQVAH